MGGCGISRTRPYILRLNIVPIKNISQAFNLEIHLKISNVIGAKAANVNFKLILFNY